MSRKLKSNLSRFFRIFQKITRIKYRTKNRKKKNRFGKKNENGPIPNLLINRNNKKNFFLGNVKIKIFD